MAIIVKHTKVSTIPDGTDTSVVRPSDWNDNHVITGLGTIATQDANNVAITGGTVSGSTLTSDTVSNNLQFTPTSAPSYSEGDVWYDNTQHTLAYYNDATNNLVHVGQEVQTKVINNTGSTIAIGAPVYITSTSSGQIYPNVALAKSDSIATSSVLGLATQAIANGAIGYVTSYGILQPCNTGLFNVGDVLYLSPYSAGVLMNTVPPTGSVIIVGVVAYKNTPNGSIYVKQQNSDVVAASTITGQVAVANGGTGASTLTGYVKGSGTSVMTASSTIPTTDLSGTVTNAQLTNSAITINGTSTALGGSINVGTVTSVTGTAPVVSSGGNTPAISMAKATTSIDGYLSATDWTTFNNKQPAGTYVNSVSGTATRITSTGGVTPVIDLASGVATPGTTGSSTLIPVVTIDTYGRVTSITTASNPQGTVTSVATTGTVNGLTLTGGPITSSGTVTLGGTLDLSSPPTIGNTTPNTGKFTTLNSTGTASLGTASTTSIQVIGDASYPGVYATGGTNTPLVLSPLGTGALQAQKTDSTATGGNARGANAVDWQTGRTSASMVASGGNSVISGGYNNTASGGFATIAGGLSHSSSGTGAFIGGGNGNGALSAYSGVAGGQSNTAAGYHNFIGGGFTNSGTSQSAVTTNTTTIALTASTTVYLSSANANIKVGQLFTGTGVSTYTYATSTVTTGTAAVMNTSTISGTTLTVGSLASGTIIAGMVLTGTGVTAGTYIVSGAGSTWTVSTSQTVASTTITGTAYTFTISQAATTTAGVTLSFYTPHGVVVGGGNNQATGAYSFIGGGGDAGTAVNRNSAAGDWSVVVGGNKNTTGIAGYDFIGGGTNNSTNNSSGSAVICGGGSNSVTAFNASILGGTLNQASGAYSSILGAVRGTTRGISCYTVFPASISPVSTTVGSSQAALLVLGRQTTDATATVLTSDVNAAGTANQVILPNNSAYLFKATVIAGVTGAGNTSAWKLEGAIKRGANAGSTAIVGTVTTTLLAQDAGASTWTITATADTTNGGLKLTFTGQAATTIRVVAKVETTEMTY
jgi:hypothetical protein